MEKDWKKEAWQLHFESHRNLNNIDVLLQSIPKNATLEPVSKSIKNEVTQLHNFLDTLVMWIEKLSDENLKLQGALEEAHRKQS